LESPDGDGHGSRLAIDPEELANPGMLAKQPPPSLAVRLEAGAKFEPRVGPFQILIERT
jgi:hypothetical protein